MTDRCADPREETLGGKVTETVFCVVDRVCDSAERISLLIAFVVAFWLVCPRLGGWCRRWLPDWVTGDTAKSQSAIAPRAKGSARPVSQTSGAARRQGRRRGGNAGNVNGGGGTGGGLGVQQSHQQLWNQLVNAGNNQGLTNRGRHNRHVRNIFQRPDPPDFSSSSSDSDVFQEVVEPAPEAPPRSDDDSEGMPPLVTYPSSGVR